MVDETATAAHGAATESLSIPFLVLAAVLIGGGLFSGVLYLLTFEWIYLGGLMGVVVGGFMLFSPRAGPDRAA